jgi:ABC-2 type transport system ATP-binding protein
MADCIMTNHLSKNFGKVRAVDGISLHVRQGEIYGFLGLNGAGKTTTIRMLLGMIKPTSGEAYLYGQKVSSKRRDLWNKVGYIVEIPYSYPDLTVRENLEIIRRLRFIADPGCVDSVMEKFQLGQYGNRLARNLSQGNAQRLGLAKAFIHNPSMLILDEPANGLDPAGIVEIREMLKDLTANRGVTVFVSSHILEEISKFANRIGIIHEGRLIQEVDSDKLDSLLQRRLLLRTRNNQKARSILQREGYAVSIIVEEDLLLVENEKAIENPDIIASLLVNAECPPLMLKIEEEDLETYFLHVIGPDGGGKNEKSVSSSLV